MAHHLDHEELDRLGRLCGGPGESGIVAAPAFPGIDRFGVRVHGEAYCPHRHDTYAIGVTVAGVQAFTYRGVSQYSLPGRVIVLHPDELHDGAAATEAGLDYRMLYVEPALLRRGLGTDRASLPFVRDPVIDDPRLRQALMRVLADLDGELEELSVDLLIAEIADLLSLHAGAGERNPKSAMHVCALEIARDYLDANALRSVSSDELEAVCGLDRFSLARQFQRQFGTSPHRYLIMRRLERARTMIHAGMTLADIAAAAGFVDQSHFSRHFKKAFGMTPGQWRKLAMRHLQ